MLAVTISGVDRCSQSQTIYVPDTDQVEVFVHSTTLGYVSHKWKFRVSLADLKREGVIDDPAPARGRPAAARNAS